MGCPILDSIFVNTNEISIVSQSCDQSHPSWVDSGDYSCVRYFFRCELWLVYHVMHIDWLWNYFGFCLWTDLLRTSRIAYIGVWNAFDYWTFVFFCQRCFHWWSLFWRMVSGKGLKQTKKYQSIHIKIIYRNRLYYLCGIAFSFCVLIRYFSLLLLTLNVTCEDPYLKFNQVKWVKFENIMSWIDWLRINWSINPLLLEKKSLEDASNTSTLFVQTFRRVTQSVTLSVTLQTEVYYGLLLLFQATRMLWN